MRLSKNVIKKLGVLNSLYKDVLKVINNGEECKGDNGAVLDIRSRIKITSTGRKEIIVETKPNSLRLRITERSNGDVRIFLINKQMYLEEMVHRNEYMASGYTKREYHFFVLRMTRVAEAIFGELTT